MALLQGHVQHNSIYYGGALADPPLNAFEYNPTHLVQLTSTSSPLETLRRGAKEDYCSRVGEVIAMVLWTSLGRGVSAQFAQSLGSGPIKILARGRVG
jgi:hypothetical protein